VQLRPCDYVPDHHGEVGTAGEKYLGIVSSVTLVERVEEAVDICRVPTQYPVRDTFLVLRQLQQLDHDGMTGIHDQDGAVRPAEQELALVPYVDCGGYTWWRGGVLPLFKATGCD